MYTTLHYTKLSQQLKKLCNSKKTDFWGWLKLFDGEQHGFTVDQHSLQQLIILLEHIMNSVNVAINKYYLNFQGYFIGCWHYVYNTK